MTINIKNIGLIGLGNVGSGFLELYTKLNRKEVVKSIAVKDKNKLRFVKSSLLVYDYNELLEDSNITLIIEAINDADEAYIIAKKTLEMGKHLVSANKKMIAEHLPELRMIAAKSGSIFRFEAAVCGSIPILDTFDSYLSFLTINSVSGIFNGSSNFILSKMRNEKISYELALKQAQELGFAELNPSLDVGGEDAANKLRILNAFAFNRWNKSSGIIVSGIANIEYRDIHFAEQRGLRLKLLSYANKQGNSFVLPSFVNRENPLYNIENEYNAVQVESEELGVQLYSGKGAGSIPTGKAMLADVLAVFKGESYTLQNLEEVEAAEELFEVYFRFPSKLPPVLNQNEIMEVFTSSIVNYATGIVSLAQIGQWAEFLNKPGYFIALLPKQKLQLAQYSEKNHLDLSHG